MSPTIFFDFSLPNATTWFYFSVILVVALFFKFDRVLSIRNWDLLSLYILVPGLLLIQEGHEHRQVARLYKATVQKVQGLPITAFGSLMTAGLFGKPIERNEQAAQDFLWWGYTILMVGSAYWMVRCIFDLTLARKPLLPPNLNTAGLAWFAVTVYVALGVVAAKRPPPTEGQIGPPSTVLQEAQTRAEEFVRQAGGETDPDVIRWRVERVIAGACHFFVLVALVLVGYRHFGDAALGMAAAMSYLLLPYLSFYMTQIHHVLPAAFLLWAVVGYRRPRVAGAMVGIAAGGFGFPLVVAPVWASFYRSRGLARFLIAFAIAFGCSLALAGLVLWLNGQFNLKIPTTIGMPQLSKWRTPEAEGFWTGVRWAYRIPVFVATIAFVIITAFWPTPKDLGQVLALSSAHLLAVQLWYADRGGVYVLWYLPMLLLMIFRPSLSERFPPALGSSAGETVPAQTTGSWALIRYFRPPISGV